MEPTRYEGCRLPLRRGLRHERFAIRRCIPRKGRVREASAPREGLPPIRVQLRGGRHRRIVLESGRDVARRERWRSARVHPRLFVLRHRREDRPDPVGLRDTREGASENGVPRIDRVEIRIGAGARDTRGDVGGVHVRALLLRRDTARSERAGLRTTDVGGGARPVAQLLPRRALVGLAVLSGGTPDVGGGVQSIVGVGGDVRGLPFRREGR
mmetsp:Transcript_30024/g.72499  ORF Transcript_30024/g.72499 Transcript_30024/m.72499 type:complete len:212 (-) Transcript_30024:684-1319(-)